MSGPHDARTEHHSPEQSTALLQAELDACRQEIARLRRIERTAREVVPRITCGPYHYVWRGAPATRQPVDPSNHRVWERDCSDDQCRNPEHRERGICGHPVHDLIDALAENADA